MSTVKQSIIYLPDAAIDHEVITDNRGVKVIIVWRPVDESGPYKNLNGFKNVLIPMQRMSVARGEDLEAIAEEIFYFEGKIFYRFYDVLVSIAHLKYDLQNDPKNFARALEYQDYMIRYATDGVKRSSRWNHTDDYIFDADVPLIKRDICDA